MKIIRTILLLALPLYFISCGTQQRLPNYIERTDSTGKGEVIIPELRIQKNDNLLIMISSAAADPRADEIYNVRTGIAGGGQSTGLSGFLVDAKGNIEYPKLGIFHAEGLTKDELAVQIKKRLTEPDTLLIDPVVLIRFQNLKFTVLGEVISQGVMSIPGERVTILEAMGLAGGITEYGLKDQVKVIRELDGKREIGVVNLTSDSLFISPYYNLMPNDVVMVYPSPKKAKKAEQDIVLQRVGFGLSIITAIALLYNIFR